MKNIWNKVLPAFNHWHQSLLKVYASVKNDNGVLCETNDSIF